jgi:conjugal transfer/entry exclusion protein
MTPELRALMYGPSTDTPPKPVVATDNPLGLSMAPTGKAITLKMQDMTLIVASAMHVSEVENQVQKLERQIKNLENMNRKLVNSYNKLAGLVRNLELEIANKVDKIF